MEENSVNSIRLNKAISDTGYCSRLRARPVPNNKALQYQWDWSLY